MWRNGEKREAVGRRIRFEERWNVLKKAEKGIVEERKKEMEWRGRM